MAKCIAKTILLAPVYLEKAFTNYWLNNGEKIDYGPLAFTKDKK